MKYKRYIPLLLLLLLMISLYVLGVVEHFNLAYFSKKRALLFMWAESHPFYLALALCATYVVSICLSLPLSSVLCVVAGMLFPLFYAVLLGVFSETLGAFLFFLIARFYLSNSSLQQKLSRWHTTKKKFHENKVYYLLFFRLSHLIPYWLINLLAVAFTVRISTFLWTAGLGVFPFVFFMTEAGSTIKHAFKQGHHLTLSSLFTTETQVLLLALGVLALTPILIKKFFHH